MDVGIAGAAVTHCFSDKAAVAGFWNPHVWFTYSVLPVFTSVLFGFLFPRGLPFAISLVFIYWVCVPLALWDGVCGGQSCEIAPPPRTISSHQV